MADTITFTGKIDYIRFYSEESSFGVIDVITKNDVPHSKLSKEYNLDSNSMDICYKISVAGKMPQPHTDAMITVTGFYEYNEKYRKDQYTIVSLEHNQPKTPEENAAYLRSIITERQAEVLLNAYPNIVQEIIDGKDSVDFSLLNGIGQTTYTRIKDKVVENFAISDVLGLLTPLGISFSKIQKMLDNEKNPQILKQKIIDNPYFIVSFPGISFKVADKIAVQLNPSLKESEKRLIAFIRSHLSDIGENAGHTWVLMSELRSAIIDNIPECEKRFDEWIEKEKLNEKFVHIEDEKIGLKRFYGDEISIWETIHEIGESEPLEISDESIQAGIKSAEEKQGFLFTEEQKDVIYNMTKSNFSILTGKAGSGKTSTARGLLNAYREAGYSVWVAAFSAKAAKRASEATGFQGSTLHRLLGIGKDGYDSESNIGEVDVLFVDENSMNPLYLMKKLFDSCGVCNIKIILCGDSRQLAPIGVGNVFSDLLEKDCFNKNVLTKIQRTAEDSGIIIDANQIRDGIDPIENKEPKIIHGKNKDLIYLFKSDKAEMFRIAVSSYLKSVREKGLGNTILLVPFKKKTLNCTKEFNKVIQKELNKENEENKFKHGEMEFWLNDYVIHTKNNYEKNIFNGFTGIVTVVEPNRIVVDYDGYEVEYTHDDIMELDLAYALTTWRFQGSEALDVIIVIDSGHYILLSSQFLYTSMTRSKERCLIISDTSAYNRCLSEDKNIRNTFMKGF